MVSKKCFSCTELKDIQLFNKDSKARDGLCYYCKDCRKEQKRQYYLENKQDISYRQKQYTNKNKDKVKERAVAYRSKNKELIKIKQKQIYHKQKEKRLEYAKVRYQANKDAIKAKVKEYTVKNRHKTNAIKAKYRASKYNATPKWLTKQHLEEIKVFYKEAKKLSEDTGELYQVDHIVPLQGVEVCGLHVPWNLQILTKTENISKFNKLVNNSV
jgi:hypothetical protein